MKFYKNKLDFSPPFCHEGQRNYACVGGSLEECSSTPTSPAVLSISDAPMNLAFKELTSCYIFLILELVASACFCNPERMDVNLVILVDIASCLAITLAKDTVDDVLWPPESPRLSAKSSSSVIPSVPHTRIWALERLTIA
ncbi:hypothetical protein FH972_005715 [Carpinus fangiana]|uniref:Uncharacterized protein n=1 Tax=Carpinus fangiana TaxID=176857 RepID=A0A5N6QQ35_9ROSI|nr:hypothetical protein FH972_005715 [Carpinus fangiana]